MAMPAIPFMLGAFQCFLPARSWPEYTLDYAGHTNTKRQAGTPTCRFLHFQLPVLFNQIHLNRLQDVFIRIINVYQDDHFAFVGHPIGP